MTEHEAQAELMILRGLAEGGGDLALVRERVDRLYWAVGHKHLRKCRCKNVEKDALLEIYAKLMFHQKTSTAMTKARLVNGVVLQVGGKHYTNANLTDEIARQFLDVFPMRKDWFSVLPPAEVKEDAENVAEMPADEPKAEKQVTIPKTKKTAKKRK